MDPEDLLLRFQTRRHFFNRCGVGLGKLALLEMLREEDARSEVPAAFGRLGAEASGALPELLRGLADKEADVRCCAAYAVGELGVKTPAAVRAL